MKHRHRVQQQPRKPASRNRRPEADKTADEQPFSSAASTTKHSTHHMKAEGGRTKPRLDKFRRGGRSIKRYDSGGPAGSSAGSTRSADDPGGEIAAANRGRKSTLDWIRDELTGGTKPAYQRGGRSKKYDAGGPAGPDPTGGMPSTQDFVSTPKVNPITRFVQSNLPPLDRYMKG